MGALMPKHRHFETRDVDRWLDYPQQAAIANQARGQHGHEIGAGKD